MSEEKRHSGASEAEVQKFVEEARVAAGRAEETAQLMMRLRPPAAAQQALEEWRKQLEEWDKVVRPRFMEPVTPPPDVARRRGFSL
jgi:hypothetical protein